jgi:DNA-binding beta-propeller fold protein YncE
MHSQISALAVHSFAKSSTLRPLTENSISVRNTGHRWFTNTLLGCFCLAILLAGFAPQPALANAALRYAYVTDPAGFQILAYSITPATGVLVPLAACFATPTPNNPPDAAVVDLTGTFLYTTSKAANTVSLWTINPLTGCLAGAPPANVFPLLGAGPVAIGISTHNGCLYVSDNATGTIDAFVINPVNGTLAPAPASPFPVGPNLQGLAVDEAGDRTVFVAIDVAAGAIAGLPSNPNNCALGAPVFTGAASPFGLAIDPAGQFLAVVNQGGVNQLFTYPIIRGGGGALGAPNPPVPTGPNPWGVAVTPFGDMTFVTNNGANTVSSYLLNAGTGAPAVNGPVHATGVAPEGITIDWTGTYFYVADSGAGTVAGYKPNVTTGKPGNAFGVWPAGVGPTAIAIQP